MKAILFDIDGVLIHYKEYFSATLSTTQFDNPVLHLNSYYHSSINQACDRGQKNPYIEIQPFLEKIDWKQTSKDFFEAQWNYEKDFIDWELLEKVNELHQCGVLLCIASCQNPYRKAFLVDKMNLKSIFTKMYFSCDIGFLKIENEYWKYVIDDLAKEGIKVTDTVFFDDMESNVNKADENGIQGKVIRTREDVFQAIDEIRETVTA